MPVPITLAEAQYPDPPWAKAGATNRSDTIARMATTHGCTCIGGLDVFNCFMSLWFGGSAFGKDVLRCVLAVLSDGSIGHPFRTKGTLVVRSGLRSSRSETPTCLGPIPLIRPTLHSDR